MRPRLPLLLCVVLTGCSTPPPAPAEAVEILPSGEAARKEYWKGKASDIRPDWDRDRLEAYLEGVRVRGRQPFLGFQGTFRRGTEAAKFYNRYVLDEDFALFVTWKEEGRLLAHAEVAGLWDLHDRIDPVLYPALRHLHRAPTSESLWDFDLVLLIRAVNAVLALGEKAPAALAAYLELTQHLRPEEPLKYGLRPERVVPVAWFVFDRHPKQLQRMEQMPDALAIPDPKIWPLFPFTLEEGLPFLVNTFSVPPLDPSSPAFSDAALRPGPLAPALDPVEAVERLTASPRWEALLTASDRFHPSPTRMEATQLKMLIREQALEALTPVYTPPADEPPRDCCKDPQEIRWTRIVGEVRALRLRWDASRQDFVRSR